MQASAKIEGLESAMKALEAAFPNDLKKQSALINGAMGGAARKSILPLAKQGALVGDGSGALSESIGVRAQKAQNRRGKAGGMQVLPVRSNRKAMMKYIAHYYTNKGKNAPMGMLTNGVRYGHLVEFGFFNKRAGRQIAAQPFLWPAAQSGKGMYISLFAGILKKRIESAVRRQALKAKKR